MSNSLQPLLRLVSPTPRPDPSRPGHLTHQEALRAIGAWLDIRGYTLDGIRRESGDLVVEATLPDAGSSDTLRFDREAIERLSAAARSDRHRDDRPPVYPVFE